LNSTKTARVFENTRPRATDRRPIVDPGAAWKAVARPPTRSACTVSWERRGVGDLPSREARARSIDVGMGESVVPGPPTGIGAICMPDTNRSSGNLDRLADQARVRHAGH